MSDLKPLLKKIDIFSNLSEEALEILASNSSIYEFPAGSTIFAEGPGYRELFFIQSGSVRISGTTESGKEQDLARYIEGEAFGQYDLLGDGTRNASARADVDSKLLVFPSRGISFEAIQKEYPELFTHVLHKMIVLIAGRIRSTNTLISEKTPWIEELRRQSYQDKLTGLPNKFFLEEHFNELREEAEHIFIVMIKPDRFKEVNDNLGHEAGDAVLKKIASWLTAETPENAKVIRYRGDEFAVIFASNLPWIGKDFTKELLQSIRRLDIKPHLPYPGWQLTGSAGLALYPIDGNKEEKVSAVARRRMMKSWRAGGNRMCLAKPLVQELLR